MEWYTWREGSVECFVRCQDGQGWWSKVELRTGGVFILIERVGTPYGTEDDAILAAEWLKNSNLVAI